MTACMQSPRVWLAGALAIAFFIKGWIIAGFVMAALALSRIARHIGEPARTTEKPREGFARMLSNGERNELDAIDAYARVVEQRGVDVKLANEVRERARQLIRESGTNDATVALRQFRQSLPQIPVREREEDSVQARLKRELEMLDAAEREVRSV
jgi:hypothetical protein